MKCRWMNYEVDPFKAREIESQSLVHGHPALTLFLNFPCYYCVTSPVLTTTHPTHPQPYLTPLLLRPPAAPSPILLISLHTHGPHTHPLSPKREVRGHEGCGA